MPGNWGFWDFNGKNGLAGLASTTTTLPDGRVVISKNPTNPAVLEDDHILYCLATSRQARDDFNRLLPTMSTEEQERLNTLVDSNRHRSSLMRDDQAYNDRIQRASVRAGVRVSARRNAR